MGIDNLGLGGPKIEAVEKAAYKCHLSIVYGIETKKQVIQSQS